MPFDTGMRATYEWFLAFGLPRKKVTTMAYLFTHVTVRSYPKLAVADSYPKLAVVDSYSDASTRYGMCV